VTCVFCEIVAGRRPARKVSEDDQVLAFHDVNPQAPVHVLVVPKRHIESLITAAPDDEALLGRLVRAARDLAAKLDVAKHGYRLVFNCGEHAGYSVFHIHLHLLGGRPFGWPPG
jgi:histidine triad (HIT) family protein